MTTTKNAIDIASAINASGKSYFGSTARGWVGPTESRIYFGREFVRITAAGVITNEDAYRARSKTIGSSAVELVESVA